MERRLITRREWLANAVLALILSIVVGTLAGGLWVWGPDISPVLAHESIVMKVVIVVLFALLYLFMLIFFGSLVEYMRLRPGLVVFVLSLLVVGIFAGALGLPFDVWVYLVIAWALVTLYVLVASA